MAPFETNKRSSSLRSGGVRVSARTDIVPGRTPVPTHSLARTNGLSASVQGRGKEEEWESKRGNEPRQQGFRRMTTMIKAYPVTACYVTITLVVALLLQFQGLIHG